MNIIISESKLQFKSPQIGVTTKAIPEHYNGRRIIAFIDDKQRMFRFTKDELMIDATEDDMIEAIRTKVLNEIKDDEFDEEITQE